MRSYIPIIALLIAFLSGNTSFVFGDSIDYVTIRQISIEGNEKTDEFIILKRVSFREGDSIPIKSVA